MIIIKRKVQSFIVLQYFNKRGVMTPFDKLFQRMTQPWVVVSYMLFIVLSIMYLDKPITLFFNGLEYNALNPILEFISRMALRNQYLVLFVL